MAAVGVLGTGQVGRAMARRAAEVGWEVTVGARSTDSVSLRVFDDTPSIRTGSFADAARSAPLVVNATNGNVSLAALESAGRDVLRGSVILDLANELTPVQDGFPVPAATSQQSLGLTLQRAFPDSYVVKALNTMNHQVMVRPDRIPGDHLAFLCGDSPEAKGAVAGLLRDFGWRDAQLMDLGGIDAAAATEMMMGIWMRVTLARGAGSPRFNWSVLDAVAAD